MHGNTQLPELVSVGINMFVKREKKNTEFNSMDWPFALSAYVALNCCYARTDEKMRSNKIRTHMH